jgi:Mn-containing catalase
VLKIIILISYSSINAQMYKTWLFNNKKKKERKDMIKYGRKWMPRMVIYQQNWGEVLKRIEDKSGEKPGAPSMFKHYQAAVKGVMAELDDDKLEKAKETAEEWSNNFPLPEIQAQVAHKKGPAYMEHFLKEMWRQCRMRVFVLSAWKNEKGEVLFRM